MSGMLDFDIDYTPAPVARSVHQKTAHATQGITETVEVIARPSQGAGYVMKGDGDWQWNDLRDFVVREIEQRHGPQPRNPKTEASIFKSFLSRWGAQAPGIARAAFGPVHQGMWRNAPISVNRFCKASDDYFSKVIVERL